MDFYMFEEWLYGARYVIITADPDPTKVPGGGPWTPVGQFTEGDGTYPPAKEAQIKRAIQEEGYYRVPREPNFFDYATTESCQNAFISWLLKWAEEQFREANEPLHRTGVEFMNRLLSLKQIAPPDKYNDVRIVKNKEDNKVDILALVSGQRRVGKENFVILIEDKVNAVLDNPLEDYLAKALNTYEGTLIPVYIRTGASDDRKAIEKIEKAGWKRFLREHLLELLKYGREQGVEDDVFRSFHTRLRGMEAAVQAKRTRSDIARLRRRRRLA